jgi:cyclase
LVLQSPADGAGEAAHFLTAFTEGRADAALAASIFHYGDVPIPSLKRWLADRGVPMRLTETSAC